MGTNGLTEQRDRPLFEVI